MTGSEYDLAINNLKNAYKLKMITLDFYFEEFKRLTKLYAASEEL